MKDAGVAAKDIQEVLLVGGMTRMPKVRCGYQGRPGLKRGRAVTQGSHSLAMPPCDVLACGKA
jgi:hypothetical protein